MNKNVFDYLNGKAHDVADYIKAKAEAAGNYISDHAQDIKNGAIKTTATLLTAAALVTGMTACDKPKTDDDFNQPLYPIVTVRPQEEIEQAGITAEDVLAVYDNLSLLKIQNIYYHKKDEWAEDWNYLSAKFTNILPKRRVFPSVNLKEFINEPFYQSFNGGTYGINYSFSGAIKDEVDNYSLEFNINPEPFENIMKSFNIEPFELTDEYWKENPTYAYDYFYTTGQMVYPSFEITRDTITNANEEQLWALYDMGMELTSQLQQELEYRENIKQQEEEKNK